MPKGIIARRNVRCSREVAFLVAQAASLLITSSPDINSPTASTVVATGLDRLAAVEASCAEKGRRINYRALMAPDADEFAEAAALPPARSISGRFLLSLSGATLLRKIDLTCARLTVDAYETRVRAEYTIRLALRLMLLSARGEDAVPTVPATEE